ncbi:tetratricopeptide repeat protein [Clostridium sp. cel8]|uniref:tetratricopeptide repeat protein n=1 Tax=Clostridium sp. cel8 TaxID=2663123 RepID=UPI0015F53306|nr:tetratricopeptide repeat protein [Clostridium sp. cel8]MBA5851721.1 tetratricopeptide repeat protein [Clostridium sp. cel8]
MDKSQKVYIKALNKYNNGYIDKSIELCEKSISMNIKNSAAINLKGLLEYLKGNITSAQKLWSMNFKVNKNEVSKRYLESSRKDINNMKLYTKAVSLMNNLKINEAVLLLEKCSKSDFNSINVNNCLAECYIKKGEYDKAIVALDKIFKIDIKNSRAKKTKKILKNIRPVHRNQNLKKTIPMFIIIILVIILCVGTYELIFNRNIHKAAPQAKKVDSSTELDKNKGNDKIESSDIKNVDNKETDKVNSTKFSYDVIKNYMANKDYDNLYNELEKINNIDQLTINDKELLAEAKNLMKSEGVNYFYEKGCNYLSNKEYANAKSYLEKALKYGQSSYIYPHIIYMLGYDLDMSGNFEGAIKYYDKYDKNYPNGDYEETVLYRLALIYKNLDISKAKVYAQKLIDKNSSSIYNNSIINSLIQN